MNGEHRNEVGPGMEVIRACRITLSKCGTIPKARRKARWTKPKREISEKADPRPKKLEDSDSDDEADEDIDVDGYGC